MSAGFLELAVIILVAAALGFAARFLKQPVILAYIFTGILLGVYQSFHLADRELFKSFSELGIMFLLFMIGLEINYTSLRLVSRTSIIVGTCQIIFTFTIGFLISLFFHFSYVESAYIGIALTFSSTIIIVKLLSEKKDLNSLYGKISVGFLLVQDFLAVLLLIFLAGIGTNQVLNLNNLVLTIIKGVILFALTLWLGRKVLPLVFDKIAKSQELLFVSSLAWCLGVAVVVAKSGFSIEIGGLLAGLALANTSEYFQISSKIKPLRDFFVLMFFVILGSSLISFNFNGIILPIIVFSLFVLIGNPLIIMVIMGFLGYRKRTAFLCGVTVAQISEFSLILAALGLRLGHLNSQDVSLISSVGIITITLSTYLIIYNEEIFYFLRSYLTIFERHSKREENISAAEFNKPIVLIGSHRIGQNIAASLPKNDLLIIDFDPDVINHLRREGYAALFGDIADSEMFDKANLNNARLVISTSPDFEDNMRILNGIDFENADHPKIILRSENEKDAEIFYEKGADYVLLPHFTSGQYLGKSISIDPELNILKQLKNSDLRMISKLKRNF